MDFQCIAYGARKLDWMRIRFGAVKLDGTQDACRKGEDRSDQLKDAAHDDPDKAEGQQDEPDERIEHECEKGHRPADDEQDEEEKQFHGVAPYAELYGSNEHFVHYRFTSDFE